MFKFLTFSLFVLLLAPIVWSNRQLTYSRVLNNAISAVRKAKNREYPGESQDIKRVIKPMLTQKNDLSLMDVVSENLRVTAADDNLCRNHTALYMNGLLTGESWATQSEYDDKYYRFASYIYQFYFPI